MNDRLTVVLKWCRSKMKDNYMNNFDDKNAFARFMDKMMGARKQIEHPTPIQQSGVDMNDL